MNPAGEETVPAAVLTEPLGPGVHTFGIKTLDRETHQASGETPDTVEMLVDTAPRPGSVPADPSPRGQRGITSTRLARSPAGACHLGHLVSQPREGRLRIAQRAVLGLGTR
jgi:hypothetical protein